MKMSFMPLLYKLMYELSRSVYRATYTTAYLRADACQRLRRGCKGRSISQKLALPHPEVPAHQSRASPTPPALIAGHRRLSPPTESDPREDAEGATLTCMTCLRSFPPPAWPALATTATPSADRMHRSLRPPSAPPTPHPTPIPTLPHRVAAAVRRGAVSTYRICVFKETPAQLFCACIL